MPNELEERAREHWSRQSIAGIVIQAITESRTGKGMALPAGRAADQILALLAPSIAFTQEAGWMPIEQAPREVLDGQHVLLWDGFSVFEGFNNWSYSDKKRHTLWSTAGLSPRPHTTHFRPLPAPPQA